MRSKHKSTTKTTDNSWQQLSSPSACHIVLIEDYEFTLANEIMHINTGDVLEFRLGDNVPLHVEHLILGTSSHVENCFESLLLNVCILYFLLFSLLTPLFSMYII